jgi:SAM-dependent methyltransferase
VAGLAASDYDAYAEQYAAAVAKREQDDAAGDPYGPLPPLLDQLGDIAGHRVLDGGCGEGYLTRALVARGARATGIDVSPRLIERARRKDPTGQVTPSRPPVRGAVTPSRPPVRGAVTPSRPPVRGAIIHSH